MPRRVRSRLEGTFDECEVVRRLHDVPPHEVYEVVVDGRRAIYKGAGAPTHDAAPKPNVHGGGRAAVEGVVLTFVGEHTSLPVPAVLHVGTDFFVAAWHPAAPAPRDSAPAAENDHSRADDRSQSASDDRLRSDSEERLRSGTDDRLPSGTDDRRHSELDDRLGATDEPRADELWARAAGRTLATLHAETADAVAAEVGGVGEFTLEPCDDGDRQLAGPSDDDKLAAPADDWHDAARSYLATRRPILARHGHGEVVDATLAALADRPDAFLGAGPAVCCHGWATPAHVAVEDGRAACVLDFEHAIAAPPAFDYWRTVCTVLDPADGTLERPFREGYECVRDLPDDLADRRRYFELLHGVQYLASLFVQDRHDAAATAERAARLEAWLRDRLPASRA